MDTNMIESLLRSEFEASLPGRVDRYARSRVHPIIPNDFFAAASSECRNLFVAGDFYGCITLAQSVGEGLARFLAEKNGLPVAKEYAAQVNILQKDRSSPVISPAAFQAFRSLHGHPSGDRNDFHHLNADVEQDRLELDARAAACIECLYTIESEVFAVDVIDGMINPRHAKYWPSDGSDSIAVFARFM